MKRVVWMYYAYAMKRPENRKTATGGSARKKYSKMTRESSDEGKRNPPQFWAEAKEPTRSTPDVAEHMGGQWQNDQKPSSRTFPDLVCLFSSGALFHVSGVTMFFFSFYSERIYLVAWFFCVFFPFRYRWRFLESREKGVSAWQNLSNSINARNLSEVWTSADWTKLNWSFDQHFFSDTCAAYA